MMVPLRNLLTLGAAIVRFIKEGVAEGETEGFRVIHSELAGIIYAIIWEEPHQKFDGAFLPIGDIIAEIERKAEFNLDVPDKEEKEWVFKTLGRGRPREGLR